MTTTEFTNPHTAEVAHDEKLLDLMRAEYTARMAASGAAERIIGFVGDYRMDVVGTDYGRTRTVVHKATGARVNVHDAKALLADLADPAKLAEVAAYYATMPSYGSFYGRTDADHARVARRAAEALAKYDEAVAETAAAGAAVEAHEEDYTGWARYFLVVTSAGHVHKDMRCTTCYDTTGYAPVPMLAAATEAEAVALLGPNMCSVCFPTAPIADVGGKLTKRLATVLMEKGEEAFRAEAAKLNAKAECPGSRTGNFDRATARMGYYAGNAGTCNVCGARVALTKANNLRAHAPKGA